MCHTAICASAVAGDDRPIMPPTSVPSTHSPIQSHTPTHSPTHTPIQLLAYPHRALYSWWLWNTWQEAPCRLHYWTHASATSCDGTRGAWLPACLLAACRGRWGGTPPRLGQPTSLTGAAGLPACRLCVHRPLASLTLLPAHQSLATPPYRPHTTLLYRRGRHIALDVAEGLVFLHGRGVLHSDLVSLLGCSRRALSCFVFWHPFLGSAERLAGGPCSAELVQAGRVGGMFPSSRYRAAPLPQL